MEYSNPIFERLSKTTERRHQVDLIKLIKLVKRIELSKSENPTEELLEKHDYFNQLLKDRFGEYKIKDFEQIELLNLTDKSLEDFLSTNKYNHYGQKVETASKLLERIAIRLLGKHDRVLDLCSGEGSFLTEYGKNYPAAKLYGIEIDKNAHQNAMVNLELNHLNHSLFNEDALDHNSLFSDSLKFDGIYSNFPISLISRYNPVGLGGYEKLKRYHLNTQKLRTHDWHFVENIINLLSETGKAVVVAPLSMLFRESEQAIRNQLIEYQLLEAIIQLPERMLNYTRIPVALMVLSHHNKEVSFVDATEMIEPPLDDKRAQLDESILDKLQSPETALVIENQQLLDEALPWIPRNLVLKNETDFKGRKLKELSNEVFRGVQILKSEYEKLLTPPENKESMRYKLILLSSYDEQLIAENLITIYAPPHLYDRYLVENNDILITSRGTLFKMALARVLNEERYVITGNIAVIRANPYEINPVYLYLFLKSKLGQRLLESIRQGSSIYIINNKDIESLKIKEVSRNKQDLLAERYLKLLEQRSVIENRLKHIDHDIETLYEVAGDS